MGPYDVAPVVPLMGTGEERKQLAVHCSPHGGPLVPHILTADEASPAALFTAGQGTTLRTRTPGSEAKGELPGCSGLQVHHRLLRAGSASSSPTRKAAGGRSGSGERYGQSNSPLSHQGPLVLETRDQQGGPLRISTPGGSGAGAPRPQLTTGSSEFPAPPGTAATAAAQDTKLLADNQAAQTRHPEFSALLTGASEPQRHMTIRRGDPRLCSAIAAQLLLALVGS
ncbi:hypothetical protein NDU88_002391 [Pleurodeles waltl]|uniref:Uncharacterized protein n=1 Tax=Pleurodeles waltl TaxID=8319 RepID=A0AAV7TMG6_PLEWA|nr:hypothetical protein NDU88_002391 [Pleurodeles waltl]